MREIESCPQLYEKLAGMIACCMYLQDQTWGLEDEGTERGTRSEFSQYI